MTVNDASLGESGSKLSKVAATSLLMGVTRASSEAYFLVNSLSCDDATKVCTQCEASLHNNKPARNRAMADGFHR